MSTITYALLTSKREQSPRGTSRSVSPPGMGTMQDALAALVPAEVLLVHALILPLTTTTKDETTTITEPNTLSWAFYVLIVMSVLLYVVPRLVNGKWDGWDFIRMLIPPLAFIGWTMIQRMTAFDVIFPNLAEAPRTLVAACLAILLGLAASALGMKADQKTA